MEVVVFNTDISKREFRKNNRQISAILTETRWNFDFEDSANILRVEIDGNPQKISSKIKVSIESIGYKCEELED